MTHEEMLLKAKEAKSAEELLAIAKENGMELTEESAKAYYEQFHKTGELDDNELDNVAGGGCRDMQEATFRFYTKTCPQCGCADLYERGTVERPYYICSKCQTVTYDPYGGYAYSNQ